MQSYQAPGAPIKKSQRVTLGRREKKMQKVARIVINCDTRKLKKPKRRGTPSSFNSRCEVGNYFSQELESFNNS